MSSTKKSYSLEELGWRQGSVFFGRDCLELSADINKFDPDDVFIVLPYSCAVVNMDFENKEPYIEVLRAKKDSKRKRSSQWGRNPRQIQLIAEKDDTQYFINASIHDRIFISHAILLEIPQAQDRILADHIDALKYWIAKRYIRNAFPTNFNIRASKAIKGLQKSIEKVPDDEDFLNELIGVYLKLDPYDQELNDIKDPYEVEIIFLVSEKGRLEYADDLTELKQCFLRVLNECNGIYISNHEVQSDTGLLISEYKQLIRLDDYDFISFKENHESPLTK